jgi:hypothetical protein
VGRADKDGKECVVFRLADPLCLVNGVSWTVAHLSRCYGPKFVQLHVGLTLDDVLPTLDEEAHYLNPRDSGEPRPLKWIGRPEAPTQLDDHSVSMDEIIEQCAEPAHFCFRQRRKPVSSRVKPQSSQRFVCIDGDDEAAFDEQVFVLDKPLCGGWVRVDLIGFCATHFVPGAEHLYYHCISAMSILGKKVATIEPELAVTLVEHALHPFEQVALFASRKCRHQSFVCVCVCRIARRRWRNNCVCRSTTPALASPPMH